MGLLENGSKVTGRLSVEKGVQVAESPGDLSSSLETVVEEAYQADPAMLMVMVLSFK